MQLSRASLFIAPLLILYLFAPTLVGIERLAFRDVSHFYTPLYDYVAARTAQQWLPLWNPLDQTGLPLIGETTTAVLYPPRYLLFLLPIATETALAWYVVAHLILASVTARWAACQSEMSPQAANLAGIMYPLSGSVLFLYTNPPFLVGAAWLPLVLGVMLSKQATSNRVRILIAAPALAMMVLGGDPQTATNAMIVIACFYVTQQLGYARTSLSVVSVLAVPFLAAVLSAPQLAASLSWSRQSDRMVSAGSWDWFGPPAPGSKRFESMEFSVPPWHLTELATANPFGSLFPIYRRTSQLLPGDGRTWTPTIYMGMLVIAAIGISLSNRPRPPCNRWTMIAIGSLALALGQFGLVMLVQSTTGLMPNVDSAAGGPYWLLYHCLPGYDAFRYPAKWLTPFALAVSIWTAAVLDRSTFPKVKWLWLAIGAAAFAIAIAIVAALRSNPSWITNHMERLPVDEFWGPLQIGGGLAQLQWSIVQSTIVLLAVMALGHLSLTKPVQWFALLVIVAIDLALAGQAMIATVPSSREQRLVDQRAPAGFPAGSRWMRTQSGDGWPDEWKLTSDPDRMLDVEASLRISRFGRWHLTDRIGILNNMVSIQSQGTAEFWKATRDLTAEMTASQRNEFWQGIRQWLIIDGVIHVPGSITETADGDRVAQLIEHRELWRPQTRTLRLAAGVTAEAVAERNNQNFARRLIKLTQESDDRLVRVGRVTGSNDDAVYSSVRLDESGLVSRPVFQDGHWVAKFSAAGEQQWETTPVYQVDRLTQGVILPRGQWDICFQYKPRWLPWSLAIAAVAWICLAVVTVLRVRHRLSARGSGEVTFGSKTKRQST